MPKHIAIVGGGYAGMACAIELAEAGYKTVVFEAGRVLGGRARRVELHGVDLDNGQHLLIGAYSELLRLIAKASGSLDGLIRRRPLELMIHRGASLRLPRLPAPLDSLTGLLLAGGLTVSEKWAAARLMQSLKGCRFRLEPDRPLAAWLRQQRQPDSLVRALWEPLCIAALNTPIDVASAQVFVNVLRDSLLGPSGSADLVLPAVDLTRLFPEPAAHYIQQRRGRVHTGLRINDISKTENGWLVGTQLFDEVVIAVGPQHAEHLVRPHDMGTANLIAALDYQPIATVWMRYEPTVRLRRSLLGFNGKITQWLFDRGALSGPAGLLAAVTSADGPHLDLNHDQLAKAVVAELKEHFSWTVAPIWTQVIVEKRATFACVHDVARPTRLTHAAGLWLAGDYVAGDYPATLEGAVRSGVAVAHDILKKGKP